MKIEMLFGGTTRFAVLETLTEAKVPITAYQIAITQGLDPAATYRCLAEFSEFGIVKSQIKERNQISYTLSSGAGRAAAKFLKSLKQKESSDLEEWLSPKMQSRRMAKIVRLDKLDKSKFKNQDKKSVEDIMSKRIPGELSALIKSSQIAFSELFEKKNNTFILKG
ncbi:MAG: hypothetical protein ACREAR_04480 [Nitrosotalea sp.]